MWNSSSFIASRGGRGAERRQTLSVEGNTLVCFVQYQYRSYDLSNTIVKVPLIHTKCTMGSNPSISRDTALRTGASRVLTETM